MLTKKAFQTGIALVTRDDRLLAQKEEEMVDPSVVSRFLANYSKNFKKNCHT